MRRHLSAAELLDLTEGAADEARYPHLASCDDCRAELADARAALGLARGIEVPEPSPLFWDHLSSRIHDAVAAERPVGSAPVGSAPVGSAPVGSAPVGSASVGSGFSRILASSGARWSSWRLAVPVGAAALAFGIVLGVLPRMNHNAAAPQVSQAVNARATAVDTPITDDPSLSFVADLASELDWDGVAQAGFTARPGDVEGVLPTLSASETAELQRLLTAALAERPARGGV